MKKLFIAAILSSLAMSAGAQKYFEMKLYPDGEAESNGLDRAAYAKLNPPTGIEALDPMMFVYLPEKSKATGQAVVICPGGGYGRTAMDHEGHMVAKWLNELGIAGIVVRYRMPNGHYEIPAKDIRTAVMTIRKNSQEWGIDTKKTGIMGFSAGGHLAATMITQYPEYASFGILIYPVITMKEEFAHMGSRYNLIGRESNRELIKRYSCEEQVTDHTPTTFLALSDDDKSVPPRNSVEFYMALKRHNIPAEMHIYPDGGHGWGFKDDFKYKQEFQMSLARWLKQQNEKQGK